MADPEIRELTASEPLSLEEEYEMQLAWQNDEDKLTFILLAWDLSTNSVQDEQPEGHLDDLAAANALIRRGSEAISMIGDVNLFLKGTSGDVEFEAEAEVMIAEPAYRRLGYAFEALQLLLSYATSPSSPLPLPVKAESLVARIGAANVASMALFKKLGFVVTKHVDVFQEVEMRLGDVSSPSRWAKGEVVDYP